MYKIFVNDKAILLTDAQDNLSQIKYFNLQEANLEQILEEINRKDTTQIALYHPKKDKILKKFAKKIKLIQAAGGVVVNEKGQILFIKRKGKWDLPKGKREKNEALQECALREVQEETGVQNLTLIGLRGVTYHIFKREGKYYLKETHWFDMQAPKAQDFRPQTEEDIKKVRWKKPKKLRKVLKKSYANIAQLFKEELKK